MTSEKDEENFAVKVSPREKRATPAKDEPVPAARADTRNFTQACRLLGTFFVFFITWGIASSFSAYQAYYQQSLLADHTPSVISWIGTVQVSLLGFTGVLSGALYDRGFFRTLLIVGGSLDVFGFMMLSLAKEYYQMILTQGLCIGIGGYRAHSVNLELP